MDNNETEQKEFQNNNKHMSISGAQQKYSLVVDNGQMRLSLEQEQATLLLKTKLSEYANKEISPANEHLTMQIASQVYNIPTAANGLCFFKMMNLPISHDVLTLHPMEENSEKKILLL